MFERGVSFTPGAAPAGRALVNWPVAYTRLPTISWFHTTPLICTVGSAAAETVSGSPGAGAVSAAAGGAEIVAVTNARFALTNTTASNATVTLPNTERRARRRGVTVSSSRAAFTAALESP